MSDNNITKIDASASVEAGQYYRRRKTDKIYKEQLNKGRVVLVTDVAKGKVKFMTLVDETHDKTDEFTSRVDEFVSENQLFPEGRRWHEQFLASLISGARSTANEITEDAKQLSGIKDAFKPRTLAGKDTEGDGFEIHDQVEAQPPEQELDEGRSVSLERTGLAQSTMLEQANRWISGLAERRNEISVKKHRLDGLQRKIKAAQLEHAAWVQSLMKFKDVVDKLEEVIGTLNLYLGSGEEIIQLTNGRPAAADIPLTIRQLVLFMDEECALGAGEGGLSAGSMEAFDKWLLEDPRNLSQVIPETKAVVCFKPRRKMKDHGTGDATMEAILNRDNRTTYILIRNGENLFRVCPAWSVGKRFFPSKEEFADAFIKRERKYNYSTHEYEPETVEIIGPDHPDYEETVENLDEQMAKYSKALILLQGLVDRTGIFPELQEAGVNLMDVTQWSDRLRFVHDADPAYLLTTGRPTFDEYVREINSELEPGDRVIGMFSKEEAELRRKERGRGIDEKSWLSRKNPKSAPDPEDMKIYSLEARRGYGLCVYYDYMRRLSQSGYYENPETGKKEWMWAGDKVPSKTRASFQVKKEDAYLLAYDRVSLEDVEYYLNDRLSRPGYDVMFPLLKLIRDLKREEREKERPLLDLLVAQAILRDDTLSDAQARREMSRLTAWYKYKNKVHRAISDDYDKACRMIIREWEAFKETREVMETVDRSDLINQLKTDRTLFIGVRKVYAFVLERADDNKIFVHKTDYYKTRAGYKRYGETKEWIIPSAAYQGWEPVYEHEDWAGWIKGARAGDFLRPHEIEKLIEDAKPKVLKKVDREVRRSVTRKWDQKELNAMRMISLDLIAVIVTDEREVKFVFQAVAAYQDEKHFKCEVVDVNWRRTKDGVDFEIDHYTSSPGDIYKRRKDANMTWDPTVDSSYYYLLNTEPLDAIERAYAENQAKRKERERRLRFFSGADSSLRHAVNEIREEKARQRYLANHGDPLNWESFKKNEERAGIEYVPHGHFDWLEDELADRYAAGKLEPADVYGLTIADLIHKVVPLVTKASRWNEKNFLIGKLDELRSEGIDPAKYVYIDIPSEEPDENDADGDFEDDEDLEEWA